MNIYVCFSWSKSNFIILSKVFERNSRKYHNPFLVKGKWEIDSPDSEQEIYGNGLYHYFVT